MPRCSDAAPRCRDAASHDAASHDAAIAAMPFTWYWPIHWLMLA